LYLTSTRLPVGEPSSLTHGLDGGAQSRFAAVVGTPRIEASCRSIPFATWSRVIDLCYSNRTEPLLDALAENVAATQTTLYDPVNLLVPNAFVAQHVVAGIARRRGIAANVKTRFLRNFLRDVAAESAPDLRIIDRDVLEAELLAVFHDDDQLAAAELAAVRGYLDRADGDRDALDRRRAQLASQLAALYDEYAYSRPEMLAAWTKGGLVTGGNEDLQRWQRALWRTLFERKGRLGGADAATLPEFFARTPPSALKVRGAAHVFGISFVARLYRSIFETLGRATTLFVYTVNPCRELWEDVQPLRRSAPRRRVSPRQLALALDAGNETAAPVAAPPADENPLLALWGRPGRDSIRLYNDLSDCNFRDRFEDPTAGDASPTLLATLQREVLDRAPRSRGPAPHDDSLTILAAPDPRRELETAAAEIWSLVRRDPALRFSDFAVVVPPASVDTYLPLAREVFTAASDLPHTVLDLPSAAEGHVLEAVELLLALPAGRLGRRDLLPLAMHPTVARRFPEVDPELFLALCEELGIVRGADAGDLANSYADDDRVSWDQGLRRLALGAFLSGTRSGEQSPFTANGETLLAAELPAGAEPAARALGIIARELIDFARTARALVAPLPAFMALLRGTLAATIRAEGGEEEAVLRDCFAILERIAETAPPGLEVGYAVAAELVRARLGVARGGARASHGVTIGSLAPLRALTFRIVFVVGLDERVFPSAQGFGTLDLRAGAPQPGDVTPREQDEYLFLETLLSARERLRLSYVGRDAVTGDRKDPSSTLLALRDVLASSHGGEQLVEAVTRPSPPLARHEDDAVCAIMPAAARERQAVALGRSLRQAGGLLQLPDAGALGGLLAPDAWMALATPLARLPLGAKADAPRRAVDTLTLTDLRRFLECPLQGSVRVLLPMRGDDEAEEEADAALRDRENLGDARPQTLPLLRELFGRALDAGATDDAALAERYDAALARLRLDGTLPSGVFGTVVRARHLGVLASWREGLRSACGGSLPRGLAPIWYGAAPEHRRDLAIRPALTLDVPLPDGPRTVTLLGQTEPLTLIDDVPVAVTLMIGKRQYLERDRLGAWLTHLARAASGAGADRPFLTIVLPATTDGKPAKFDRGRFEPVDASDARSLLTDLATDLLRDVHPYLMPCEGVFTWERRRRKGEKMTVPEAVMMVRDDTVTRLSSRYGPVADATRYPVPDARDAAAYVARRFNGYFTSFQELP
jgi:exodeoxyribonuclease V gamma subunit